MHCMIFASASLLAFWAICYSSIARCHAQCAGVVGYVVVWLPINLVPWVSSPHPGRAQFAFCCSQIRSDWTHTGTQPCRKECVEVKY